LPKLKVSIRGALEQTIGWQSTIDNRITMKKRKKSEQKHEFPIVNS
jgi:hypothetical protein